MMLDTDLRRLLLETAFVGAGHGFHKEAESILKALELDGCNPLSVAVGKALSLLGQGLFEDAVKQLEPLVDDLGSANEADALLALALLRQGQASRAESYLKRCEKSSGVLADMAKGLRQDFKGGVSHYSY